MTEQQELAILREVASKWCGQAVLHDLDVRQKADGACYVYYGPNQGVALLTDGTRNIAECVFLARQKLAVEREAAISPNERKYKAALEKIVANHCRKDGSECPTYHAAKAALREE